MSNVISQNIIDSPYITTAEPSWLVEMAETGTAYDFDTFDQFDTAQRTCGGARLDDTFEGCMEWLLMRHDELEGCDAEESSFPWCSSGIWASDESFDWLAWYETTSRTTFVTGVLNGAVIRLAHLPEGRGDTHRQLLVAALLGRTIEQYHRWYNAYLLDSEEREAAYAEESAWWNQHMVPTFAPRATLEQLKLSRKIDRVVGAFYGEWASKYGPVGDAIKTALGSSNTATTGMRPQEIDPEKVDEMWNDIEYYLMRCLERLQEARNGG